MKNKKIIKKTKKRLRYWYLVIPQWNSLEPSNGTSHLRGCTYLCRASITVCLPLAGKCRAKDPKQLNKLLICGDQSRRKKLYKIRNWKKILKINNNSSQNTTNFLSIPLWFKTFLKLSGVSKISGVFILLNAMEVNLFWSQFWFSSGCMSHCSLFFAGACPGVQEVNLTLCDGWVVSVLFLS